MEPLAVSHCSILLRIFNSTPYFVTYIFFVALCLRTNPCTDIGGTNRCGFGFPYAGSLATDIGLLLVALASKLFHHVTFSMRICFLKYLY
jgi:hypothetical protein